MDKLNLQALGERLKIGGERLKAGGAEMSRKVSLKMKEILQGQSQEAKMVDEATSDSLTEANWGLNLRICSLLSADELNGSEVMRAIKRKIACKSVVSQRLCLDLLDVCAMNSDKTFSMMASERVLDEMIKMIEDPQSDQSNKRVAFRMIKAWGESEDLLYLPVFRLTYMNLKARGDPFNAGDRGTLPAESTSAESMGIEGDDVTHLRGGLSPEEKNELLVVTRNGLDILSSLLDSEKPSEAIKDDLTLSMVKQCKDAQPVIQRIMEMAGDDEDILFRALNIHEELEVVLAKYAEMESAGTAAPAPASSPGTVSTAADNISPEDRNYPDNKSMDEHVGMKNM